ncbi:uncharacterized protein LOC141613575 [Silene latifolia]|uniref:uncharacterized protein LOC141613575 n=1 Tax=Silene latifolia TaxID=37657 RepID=UPI003D772163
MMKLDIQKAYDSVECFFVREMMQYLGFPEQFIDIVIECVTTPSYTVSLNGENFGFFHGMRGLRQGDPLSPLLFTLCLEYFSRVVGVVQKHDIFRFHPLYNRIQLTHLCFADNLILFCRGDKASNELLLRAFAYFSKASGLVMNSGKSRFYCNGVDDGFVTDMEQQSGMKRGTVPFKYLGVNVAPKRLSILDCNCLVERIDLYFTKDSYQEIEAVCRDYLWHGNDHKENPALVSWDQICHQKKHGGLGLKDLYVWNVSAIVLEHYTIRDGYQWLRLEGNIVSCYSRRCMQMVADWCLIQLSVTDCIQWWVKWKTPALRRKKVVVVIVACLMAHIWFSRNKCRLDGYVIRSEVICRMVKEKLAHITKIVGHIATVNGRQTQAYLLPLKDHNLVVNPPNGPPDSTTHTQILV